LGLVRESLPEYLAIARYATSTRKPKAEGRGWYDFPAALLLLVIADAIGSFYEGDQAFQVEIDGRRRSINASGVQHFYILNSELYGLALSGAQLDIIYEDFRCLLAHNASLPRERLIARDQPADPPFGFFEKTAWINMPGLLTLTERAVTRFLDEAAARRVPASRRGRLIEGRRP
jgi:hypothetical protein